MGKNSLIRSSTIASPVSTPFSCSRFCELVVLSDSYHDIDNLNLRIFQSYLFSVLGTLQSYSALAPHPAVAPREYSRNDMTPVSTWLGHMVPPFHRKAFKAQAYCPPQQAEVYVHNRFITSLRQLSVFPPTSYLHAPLSAPSTPYMSSVVSLGTKHCSFCWFWSRSGTHICFRVNFIHRDYGSI